MESALYGIYPLAVFFLSEDSREILCARTFHEVICIFYTDTTVLHPYKPVGCFKDKRDPRALPVLVQKFSVNETDLANSFADIIHACATEVFENGFWYFSLEFRHQCWSGVNGGMTYNRHGRSDKCLSNYSVGSFWTIFVYRFVEVDHFTENLAL